MTAAAIESIGLQYSVTLSIYIPCDLEIPLHNIHSSQGKHPLRPLWATRKAVHHSMRRDAETGGERRGKVGGTHCGVLRGRWTLRTTHTAMRTDLKNLAPG